LFVTVLGVLLVSSVNVPEVLDANKSFVSVDDITGLVGTV